MKCFAAVLAIASVLAVASTATLDELPGCAMNCALQALSTRKCSGGDLKCTCTDPVFLDATTACVTKSCNATEITAAAAAKKSMCAEYSTTPTTPAPTNGSGSNHTSNHDANDGDKNGKPDQEKAGGSTYSVPESRNNTSTYTTGNHTTTTVNGGVPRPSGTGVPTIPSTNDTRSTNSTPTSLGATSSSGTGKVSVVFSFIGLGLLAAFAI